MTKKSFVKLAYIIDQYAVYTHGKDCIDGYVDKGKGEVCFCVSAVREGPGNRKTDQKNKYRYPELQ